MSGIDDPRLFGRVAVLLGGTSSEREVSLDSGAGVLAALQRRGVDAFAVDGVPALIDAIRDGRVDRVFNILHGTRGGGEDGVLQGLLDALGVPYTGTGVLGAALSMDKIRSKQVWQALDLPTPDYRVLRPGDDVAAAAAELGLPVIVKPAREGSSVGVSRVHVEADLEQAVALAARYDGELLMERLIEGDEFTVAILDGEALPSIRIVPAGSWYDYHAKYVADDTQYLCPGSEGEAERALRTLALDAFHALDVTGWGRVDVMRDRDGGFWLLEVNTAPGMTSHSLVPKAAAAVGIDYDALCWRVLEGSLDRGGGP
jgi:D-alanine-D-alanine ligase